MPGQRAYRPYTAKEKAAQRQMEDAHATATKVNGKMGAVLANLYGRWRDEGQYEDFADYEKVIKKAFVALKVGSFIAGSKRPFGFRWEGKDGYTRLTSINASGWVQTARLV